MTNVFPSWHKPNLVLILQWGRCGYFCLVQILVKILKKTPSLGIFLRVKMLTEDVTDKNFQLNPHPLSFLWMLNEWFCILPSLPLCCLNYCSVSYFLLSLMTLVELRVSQSLSSLWIQDSWKLWVPLSVCLSSMSSANIVSQVVLY